MIALKTLTRITVCVILALYVAHDCRSQLLYTESFAWSYDTAKRYYGSIAPSFNFQTPKEDFIQFMNTADLSLHFGKRELKLANSFQLVKSGSEVILSGGYLYAKFVTSYQKAVKPEIFAQYQWKELRGIEEKYASGADLRMRFHRSQKGGIYFGLGGFYEYERWNYDAVPEDQKPADLSPVIKQFFKITSYFSIKWKPIPVINTDLGLYYQSRYDRLDQPRLGCHLNLEYQVTKHLTLGINARTLYDYAPIVPVDPWLHAIFQQLRISF